HAATVSLSAPGTVHPYPVGTADVAAVTDLPAGTPATYDWSVTTPGTLTPDAADPSKAHVQLPVLGPYTVQVVVHYDDGSGTPPAPLTASTNLTAVNGTPTASIARLPATVLPGAPISLPASAADPNKDPLSYTWKDPAAATFSDPSALKPTWSSTVHGQHTITLIA